MRESKLTKEWSDFDPKEGYEKEMQDVELQDGTILMMCWPNGGIWNVCMDEGQEELYRRSKKMEFKTKETKRVRLTHSKKWHHD